MKSTHALLAGTLVLALAFTSAQAAPEWTLRTDDGGQPLVLFGGAGLPGAARIAATSDGFVVVYDQNGSSSAHELFVLDSLLESANNAATSAVATQVQIYNTGQELWEASTTSNEKSSGGTTFGRDGITRPLADDTHLSWSGGGTAGVAEYQFQDDAGNYDADHGKAAELATFSISVDTNKHKEDLEMFAAAGGDTYQILTAVSGMEYIRKVEFGALTGLVIDPGDSANNTSGTRSTSNGGLLVDGSNSHTAWKAELVPGVDDTLRGMTVNPADGLLYFISHDATNDQVYLSAVSFEWGTLSSNSVLTIEDINPGAAENYVVLTYDSGDTAADLIRGFDIAFSADGSRLFVRSETSSDRIWQFDYTPVPEPATLALLGLGGLAMAGSAVRRRRRR